jgi:hypothetical protein
MAIKHVTINNERELFLFVHARRKWLQDFEFTPCRFPVNVTYCETSSNCYPVVELWDEYLPEEYTEEICIKTMQDIISDALVKARHDLKQCKSEKSGPTYQYLEGRLASLIEITDEIRKSK